VPTLAVSQTNKRAVSSGGVAGEALCAFRGESTTGGGVGCRARELGDYDEIPANAGAFLSTVSTRAVAEM
jgi:hypothetical protein